MDRLNLIWKEIEQQCRELNCFEFEYYWEMYDEFWNPWFIEANGNLLKFTVYDISNGDLRQLADKGHLEIIKVYDPSEMKDENDRIRYRIKQNPHAEVVMNFKPDASTNL